jgi:hypothetical protein
MPINPFRPAATPRCFALMAAAGAAALALSAAAHAQDNAYEFIAPPSKASNAIYALNNRTGEIRGCIYQRVEGQTIGEAVCYESGSGASAQGEGAYGLYANNLEKEGGVIRVNFATGAVAYCWIDFKGEQTVCTEQAE